MEISSQFQAHLASGQTNLCRAWALVRTDGLAFGFTDHDRDLAFDGMVFRADTGLSAQALEQTTGLSVDNTQALGALSDAQVSEEDIRAGRFDGAQVRAWLVNWADPSQRIEQFRGTIGEITREGPAFRAELRGQAEALNQPQGRVFQTPCAAVLGDAACGVDLADAAFGITLAAGDVRDQKILQFPSDMLASYGDRWFEKGRVRILSGPAAGLVGMVKNDRLLAGSGAQAGQMFRTIELWESLRAPLQAGDQLRLEAGCDKRAETCRIKFANMVNFRGFPHIPGEDWLMAVPRRAGKNDGGALR